jgi:hypothetical protein
MAPAVQRASDDVPPGRPDRIADSEPTDPALAGPGASRPRSAEAAVAPAATAADEPVKSAPPVGRTAGPSNGPDGGRPEAEVAPRRCTPAQLRRFIKSRPYVPMHELRRRFGIEGIEDDVTIVRLAVGSVFVGLPEPEGRILGDLLKGGDIGYELSLDPLSPIVVGVYPMRPVSRA